MKTAVLHRGRWVYALPLLALLTGCTSLQYESHAKDGSGTRIGALSINGTSAKELIANVAQSPLMSAVLAGGTALLGGGGLGGIAMAVMAGRSRKREDAAWSDGHTTGLNRQAEPIA